MNHLAREKSPYLLQHKDNPVHWYPWGDAAFEAARRDDRPIFLSIGYSTCHWCHVMAHESFEDEQVARILNAQFVSIKVDREERPDVDRMYMAFVQATTGGGGWPMSVWLTPDLRPFHGGTYFPPVSRWGQRGFADLLLDIARLWRDERQRVLDAAESVGRHLAGIGAAHGGAQVPGTIALDGAAREFAESFDERFGGFGGAPKFPRPAELLFLLREHRRTGDRPPLDVVVATLRAMAAGGMRDHVGGGFHRYSVDAQWRVPHFEKMLYDQAQLVLAYVEAAQATGDLALLEVAEDTLRYVQRELTDAGGAFHSAEDADSLPPGGSADGHKTEGAFYLWSWQELGERLGADADVFRARFGVEPGGNALQDPHGEFGGLNILYEARSIEDVAEESGLAADQVRARLVRARAVLLEARSARPRPGLDDKVLTAWNGLMIAAFARASRVVAALGEAGEDRGPGTGDRGSGYLDSARRAASFIRARMWDPAAGRLLRRYRDGDAAIGAFAEDYAYLVFGLLELFQADGDPAWLAWALELRKTQDELFWDAEAGGWFSTTGQDPSVLLRLKEDYDGAEPSASSVSVLNLIVLSHLTGDQSAAEQVERTLKLFAPRLTGAPRAVPMMLSALSAWHAGFSEAVVVGARDGRDTAALLDEIGRAYQPFLATVRVDPNGSARPALLRLLPWLDGFTMRQGEATAYLCRQFTCQAPTTDPSALRAQLA
jgi:uncharacterized protein